MKTPAFAGVLSRDWFKSLLRRGLRLVRLRVGGLVRAALLRPRGLVGVDDLLELLGGQGVGLALGVALPADDAVGADDPARREALDLEDLLHRGRGVGGDGVADAGVLNE